MSSRVGSHGSHGKIAFFNKWSMRRAIDNRCKEKRDTFAIDLTEYVLWCARLACPLFWRCAKKCRCERFVYKECYTTLVFRLVQKVERIRGVEDSLLTTIWRRELNSISTLSMTSTAALAR